MNWEQGPSASPIDYKALTSLYRANIAAKALFDHFASRTNNSNETKLDRALQISQWSSPTTSVNDVREVFKALERAGCGQYIIGRRGHPSRFAWSTGLVSVAQAARGEGLTLETATNPQEAIVGAANILEHSFQLRMNVRVVLRLPQDLTVTEADRLAGFIRTLPFEPRADSANGGNEAS